LTNDYFIKFRQKIRQIFQRKPFKLLIPSFLNGDLKQAYVLEA